MCSLLGVLRGLNITQHILDLMYLLLRRYRRIYKLAQTVVISEQEFIAMDTTLTAIVDAFDTRFNNLLECWRQQRLDTALQCRYYAGGICEDWWKKKVETVGYHKAYFHYHLTYFLSRMKNPRMIVPRKNRLMEVRLERMTKMAMARMIKVAMARMKKTRRMGRTAIQRRKLVPQVVHFLFSSILFRPSRIVARKRRPSLKRVNPKQWMRRKKRQVDLSYGVAC